MPRILMFLFIQFFWREDETSNKSKKTGDKHLSRRWKQNKIGMTYIHVLVMWYIALHILAYAYICWHTAHQIFLFCSWKRNSSSSSNTHINPNSSTFLIKSQKHSHCPHSCIQPFMFTLISLNHPKQSLMCYFVLRPLRSEGNRHS